MRLAETVTFGGSGLNRAAELRGDADALARMLGDPAARVLPIWRGKPLFSGTDPVEPGWLKPGHPVLRDGRTPVFLGIDDSVGDGVPQFAQDVSDWQPVDQPEEQDVFFDPTEQRHPDLPSGVRFAELRGAMAALSPRAAELIVTAKAVLGWHRSHRFCAICGAESVMAMGGWQRDCPVCGGHHFPRTDPVVIMLIVRANSLLIGRSPHWPEGMYSLLAGFVEPGETLEGAVRREVLEETGVTCGPVSYLASQPWPFPSSLMFGCLAEATSEAITLDPAELDDAIWVTREEMAEIYAGRNPNISAARKGSIAHFLIGHWLADRLD
ncbi:MAG: NAD(+) diphosphatase [Rhodobacteraceae bacterium]|nr:NAD(+) diphosphatase [Paracoccaceae bacterium]